MNLEERTIIYVDFAPMGHELVAYIVKDEVLANAGGTSYFLMIDCPDGQEFVDSFDTVKEAYDAALTIAEED